MRAKSAAVLVALGLPLLGVTGIGVAHADPQPSICYDSRLCGDLGAVEFCPDTGTQVSAFEPCPSRVVGPYLPGGLSPNE